MSARRAIARHLAAAAVLLCLQAAATVMSLRRDPLDRFQGTAVSGLVWWSLQRRRPPLPRPAPRR